MCTSLFLRAGLTFCVVVSASAQQPVDLCSSLQTKSVYFGNGIWAGSEWAVMADDATLAQAWRRARIPTWLSPTTRRCARRAAGSLTAPGAAWPRHRAPRYQARHRTFTATVRYSRADGTRGEASSYPVTSRTDERIARGWLAVAACDATAIPHSKLLKSGRLPRGRCDCPAQVCSGREGATALRSSRALPGRRPRRCTVTGTGLYSPSRSCANGETRCGLPLRISRATRIRSLATATPVGRDPAPRP